MSNPPESLSSPVPNSNPQSRRVLLEVCVASADDAVAAWKGGADRLELNSALELGGLTPSLGLLREVLEAVPLPVIAMIRPRPGGFAYSDSDYRVMLRDLHLMISNGAHGAAFGILTEQGMVDVERCRLLIRRIREAYAVRPGHEKAVGPACVFHRAFDVVADPFLTLETLIELGFTRVMTSGQEESAYNGIPVIAELIRKAAGRMEILPAGGINRFTIDDVLRRTGCDQVHASLRSQRVDRSVAARPAICFGKAYKPDEDRYGVTNLDAVADLRSRSRTRSD